VQEWSDYIQGETLSLELVPGPVPGDVAMHESFKLSGYPVALGIRRG